MNGFVIIAIAGLLGSIPSSEAFDCNITRFDEASARTVFFGDGPREALTSAELTKRCQNFDRDIGYLNEHTKNCFSGLANGMVKLVLEGATADISRRCVEGPSRETYLRMIPCLNSHGKEFHRCNRNLAAVLESANSKPKKSRVPLSCCYMGVFVDCVTKTARKCSAEHQRVAKEIIDYYAEDILSTVCVKWKYNSKACKELPKISPVPSPKYKALLPPLAEVLASLQ